MNAFVICHPQEIIAQFAMLFLFLAGDVQLFQLFEGERMHHLQEFLPVRLCILQFILYGSVRIAGSGLS